MQRMNFSSIGKTIQITCDVQEMEMRDKINLFYHLAYELGVFADLTEQARESIAAVIKTHWK